MTSKAIYPFNLLRAMRISLGKYGKTELALEAEKVKNLFYKWGIGINDYTTFQDGQSVGDGIILIEKKRNSGHIRLFDNGTIKDETSGEIVVVAEEITQLLIEAIFGRNELKNKKLSGNPIFQSILSYIECTTNDCDTTLNKSVEIYLSTTTTQTADKTIDPTNKKNKNNRRESKSTKDNSSVNSYTQLIMQIKEVAEKTRTMAIQNDHWHNSIKPKEISAILDAYMPFLNTPPNNHLEAKGIYITAQKMMVELFHTNTANTFYWNLIEYPALQCSTATMQMDCRYEGHVTYKAVECGVIGISKGCNFFISDDGCVQSTVSTGERAGKITINIVGGILYVASAFIVQNAWAGSYKGMAIDPPGFNDLQFCKIYE